MDSKPIFIIGFTAVGKTTVGRALATALKRTFIDSDLYIEQRYHDSISNMFATCGIDKFRKREKTILIELSLKQDSVVATGGGMASYDDNIEMMLQRGTVIYLTAPREVLIERLYTVRDGRAITEGMSREEVEQYVHDTLPKRLPAYEKAHHTVDVSRLENDADVETVVQEIVSLLRAD